MKAGPWLSLDPQERIDRADTHRLGPVAEALCRRLDAVLSDWDNGAVRRDLRIGLFGRLGQGKSTVLNEVRARLVQKHPTARLVFFPCSRHRPEVLEQEIDRIIGRELLCGGVRSQWKWVLAIWLELLAAVGLLVWIAWYVTGGPDALLLLAPVTGVGLTVLGWLWAFISLLRDRENFLWGSFADISPPTVLIVDDLDRATVVQQRAVLRALRVWTTGWRLPMVVAMDDAALLNGASDPEAPDELLRKIIDATYRLPSRTAEDAARMVTAAAGELVDGIAGRLGADARLQGDWVRVLLLLPDLGPRRVRRFLNDLFVAVDILGLTHPEEVAALTRLQAVFTLAPALRDCPGAVIDALIGNDAAGLVEVWRTLPSSRESKSEASESLSRLIGLTRHLQPPRRDWQRFVAHFVAEGASDRLISSGRRVASGFSPIHWPGPDASASSVRSGFGVPDVIKLVDTERASLLLRHWPAIEAALTDIGEAHKRWWVLQDWRKQVEEYGNHAWARHLLLRVWLGDAELLGFMDETSRRALLREAMETPESRSLLLAVPGIYFYLVERILLIADPGFGSWDSRPVAAWLAEGERRHFMAVPVPTLVAAPPGGRLELAIVSTCWPTFLGEQGEITTESVGHELAWHFAALRGSYDHGATVRPLALSLALIRRGWLQRQAERYPREVLVALGWLFHLHPLPDSVRPEAPLDPWAGEGIGAFESLFADEPPTSRQRLIARVALPDTAGREAEPRLWWLAFLLAAYYGDGPLMQRWADEWPPLPSSAAADATASPSPPATPPIPEPGFVERLAAAPDFPQRAETYFPAATAQYFRLPDPA